jgi:hypothetical protein
MCRNLKFLYHLMEHACTDQLTSYREEIFIEKTQ